MKHYDDETLSRYGLDRSLVSDREAIEAHLAECETCRGSFTVLMEIDKAMRDPRTWANVDALRTRSARVEEALALKARIDAEDAAAARLLSPLLVSPIRFRNATVAENPKAQTAGIVRFLCAAAHERHERSPEFSEELTSAAYDIAVKLDHERPVTRRFCVAISLRERGNALKYLGRFFEALTALEQAERLFDAMPAADPHDIAIVWYIRGMVFVELDRLDEARVLAARCAQIFSGYRDQFRELAALLLGASCFAFAGKNREAAVAYEEVAEKARVDSSRDIRARAVNAAANAYLELGEFQRAEGYYIEALVLFDELGLATEKARVTWSLALVLLRRGDLEMGAERLDAARTELRDLGLLNDYALATLDWAAARLASGLPRGVADACKGIIVHFESEGMMRNARLALAHLQEALFRKKATPALVLHVRRYLEHLPSHPDDPFQLPL